MSTRHLISFFTPTCSLVHLIILNAKIRKVSSGDTRIDVAKSLDISISGSGDLYYTGSPDFKNIHVTGSGDIVKIK